MKPKTKRALKKYFRIFLAGAVLVSVAYVFYHLGSLQSCEPVKAVDSSALRVKLFYFNKIRNKLASLERQIKPTQAPIQTTIRLLLKGKLSAEEKIKGFQTEFPNPEFKLLGAKLINGILVLKFTEVPGFTSGGAERVSLLAEQIKKTALQFPNVKKVVFDPEYLFQP